MVFDVSGAEPLIEVPSGSLGLPRHHHCGLHVHRLSLRASQAPPMMSRVDDKPLSVQEALCCSTRGDSSDDAAIIQNDVPFESGGHQLRRRFGELRDAFIVERLGFQAVGRPPESAQFAGTRGDV